MSICNDDTCVACRAVEYAQRMAEAGYTPGEIIAAFSVAVETVFDVELRALEVPADFFYERPGDDEAIH